MKKAIIIVAGLLLAACGSGGNGQAGNRNPAWQSKLGCTAVNEQDTEELFVLALFSCTKDNGSETRVYTFQSNTARDNWVHFADGSALEGITVVLNEGNKWVEVKS